MALVLPALLITSCSDDDDNVVAPEISKTYKLGSVSNPDINGTAKFIKNVDNSTTIELQLKGTSNGGMHPAHIHFNTAAESGEIALNLESVNGDTGFSTTTTSALKDGSEITYEELLKYNGYINVHVSADDLGTLVAQGDIGQNELTGMSSKYPLASVSNPEISGSITFEKRENGEALATIDLEGTEDDVEYPAHIHMGSVANAPGDIIVTFASVNGTTGISKTNVSNLDGKSEFFGYEKVMAVDGYVNVHNPVPANLSVLVAQGDIGKNK